MNYSAAVGPEDRVFTHRADNTIWLWIRDKGDRCTRTNALFFAKVALLISANKVDPAADLHSGIGSHLKECV
jgi:hypothetical protein